MGSGRVIEQQSRSQTIDILKGVCIFFVLWGHCIQYLSGSNSAFFDNWMFKFLYSFHMPLFMLISGYLFGFSMNKYNAGELWERKISILFRSIVVGSILTYFLTQGLRGIFQHQLSVLIDGKCFSSILYFWFLWSLLACCGALCILQKIHFGKLTPVLWFLLGCPVVILFPFCTYSLYLYPYFILGVVANQHSSLIKKYMHFKWIAVFLFAVMLCFYERKHYIYLSGIYSGQYSLWESLFIDVFRWIIGLTGCITCFTFVDLLSNFSFMQKMSLPGKYTLQIYILQVIFLERYLPKILAAASRFFLLKTHIQSFLSNPFLLAFAISLPVAGFYCIFLYKLTVVLDKKGVSKFLFGR